LGAPPSQSRIKRSTESQPIHQTQQLRGSALNLRDLLKKPALEVDRDDVETIHDVLFYALESSAVSRAVIEVSAPRKPSWLPG
jgi:hypothetical protein